VQLVAPVDDQLSVEVWPAPTEAGLAESDSVGGGAVTDTLTDFEALPAAPVQITVYVDVAVGATGFDPAVAMLPDHAPDPEQLVALLDDHERFELCPLAIVVGLAASDTVVGGATVTDADFETVPPVPVQVSE